MGPSGRCSRPAPGADSPLASVGPDHALPFPSALRDVRRQTGGPACTQPLSEDPLTQTRAVPHSAMEKEDFQST